ncbi:hypothetical protein CQY20_21615 [Mycolicibacterium agri]|nr:hypothetical protein CQY20_21615 [Mycolicibacterium agri]
MRPALAAAAAVLTIAAAALVWQNLPTPTDVLGPFDVHGDAGETVTGRGVSATVDGVRIASTVNGVAPAGVWVVVDAAFEGTHTTELPHSALIVGPNTYSPSEAFTLDLLLGEVSPGITQRGSLVFDVARDLVEPGATAPMTLNIWVGDGRMDSRLSIRLPMEGSRFSRVDAVTLDKPEVSASP